MQNFTGPDYRAESNVSLPRSNDSNAFKDLSKDFIRDL